MSICLSVFISFPFFLHPVEMDKDPTQCLVCEVPKEEKPSTTQIPEQKASALPSEESVTVETAAPKISSKLVQPGDICAKPTIEPKDVKPCDISTEVPPPRPLTEPLPAKPIAEQCKLASLQTTQEVAPQRESLLEAKEPQQADSQASTCFLADPVCKLPVQEAATLVTQTAGIEPAPIETKPETPVSAAQDTTQPAAPISVDSPQNVAIISPTASEVPIKDTVKCAIESAPVTQPLTIDPGEQHAEMLLAASEISTVSPVPIQVAESVLQAEPKESVLGAAVVVSDEAIATTVTAVHESTDVASAPIPMEPVQLNGSACETEKCADVATVAAAVPELPKKTDASSETIKVTKDVPSEASPVVEEKILISSSVVSLEASPVEKLAEQVVKTEAKSPEQIAKTETVEAKPVEQITKPETAEAKPLEQIAKTEAMEEKSAEQAAKTETPKAIVKQAETIAQAEITEATSTEQTEIAEAAAERSPSEIPESPIAEQSPPAEEPIEAKSPDVPLTPTVTEATPPTSPSVESAQEMEEAAAKKCLKKSDSADGADGEGADKKTGKKAVKKVTKKPKAKPEEAAPSAATEGAVADGSQSKAKKTVKTTKKTGAKTSETDTSVPETPPPPTSGGAVGVDAPVPPKRKTKGSNAKGTSGKKPETEE